MEVDRTLRELIGERGRAWIDGVTDVRVAFPGAGRHVGRDGAGAVTLTAETGDEVTTAAWRLDDAARVLLLRTHGDLALALELYLSGDARERCGALRALAFVPGAATDATALPAILDAMRSANGEIFEAGVLDNAYAAVHLPQHEWRKAALKAIFVGHSIRRVVRLAARADAELAHSLRDLAAERAAAGRPIPDELWPLVGEIEKADKARTE